MLIYDNRMENIMNRINIILIKVLFIGLLLSFAVQCCAATTLSVGDTTADPGDTVTIPIMIDSIEDYGTGTINLAYDSAAVSVMDVTGGSDSTVTAKNIDNTAGLVRLSAWNIGGVSGNIVFADVTVKAVGNSGDSTTLTLTVDKLQDISYNEIPVNINSGSFTLAGQASTTPASTPPTPSPHEGTDTSLASYDGETDTNPTIAQSDGELHPAPHDTETDANPSTQTAGEDGAHSTPQSTAKSTPEPPSSTVPGFEGTLLIIGLLTAYLIARQSF